MDALNNGQRGQSLIELLVAIGVAGIFITGATLSLDVAIRSTKQNKQSQPAAQLAQELLDNVSVVSQSNWASVVAVAGPSFISTSGVFSVATGKEIVASVSGVDYQRYFIVSDLPAGADPSRKVITVTVEWPAVGPTNRVSLSRSVTRHENAVFRQTDWSGGAGQPGAFQDATKFDTRSNMTVSEGGSLSITGLPHP